MKKFLLRMLILGFAFIMGPGVFGLTMLVLLLNRLSPFFHKWLQGVKKRLFSKGKEAAANRQLSQKQLHRKYDRVLGVNSFLRDADCLFIDQNGQAVMSLEGCPFKFYSSVDQQSGRTVFESVVIPKEYEKAVASFLNGRGLLRSVALMRDDSRDRLGGFTLASCDADRFLQVMNSLGAVVSAEKTNRVEFTVTNTNKYAVPGCGTYEEALKVLRDSDDRSRFLVEGSSRTEAKVNGEVQPEKVVRSGADGPKAVVNEPGTFIIEESSVQHFAGVVEGDPSLGGALVEKAVGEGAVRALDNPFLEYIDLTDLSCREVLIQGEPFMVVSESMSDDNFSLLTGGGREYVIHADSIDKVLAGEVDPYQVVKMQPEGSGSAPRNDYVITVPVTVSSSLHTVSDSINRISSELMDTYGMNGLTPMEARLTAFAYLMSKDDGMSVCLGSGRIESTDGVRVNGVDFSEVKSLRESEVGRSMDEARMQSWLHDAALVHDVDIKVDPETMKMNVSVDYADGRHADFSRDIDMDGLRRVAQKDMDVITKKDLAMHLLAGKVGEADGNGPSFLAYPEFDWQKGNSYRNQNECLDAFVEGRQPRSEAYSLPDYARNEARGKELSSGNDVRVRTGLTI